MEGVLLFKIKDLHSLYTKRLTDLGIEKCINKTVLKQSILDHFKTAHCQYDGKGAIIVFNEGMQAMLKSAIRNRHCAKDAQILRQAANIVRKDILNHNGFRFSGKFSKQCQEKSVPMSAKSLVAMICNGPNIKHQSKCNTQVCLTTCQILVLNTKKTTTNLDTIVRHTLEREPPLPIYIGLKVHTACRSKELIKQLNQIGVCVSYDRIVQLEEWMATSSCERFEEDGVVAPVCLRKGIFTVAAIDNLDHNPSATTASSSFHGTGISIFQLPSKNESGIERSPLKVPPSQQITSLPKYYTDVPAVALQTSSVAVPKCHMSSLDSCIEKAKEQEEEWTNAAIELLPSEQLSSKSNISWSAHHASRQAPTDDFPAVRALLPLFYEKSNSPAMIKHGMNVVKKTVEFLNDKQIPVMTADQPLFALAKFVQWKWPATHGEEKFVVMLGGLHTEMALWKSLGDILEGSGWTTALTEAGLASSGTANSYLKAAHLSRTRHAHQVSLLTLRKLMNDAFMMTGRQKESFLAWKNEMSKQSPTFLYWTIVEHFETLILMFVRAHREKNFNLYVEVLEELVPLFFSMDHSNYARWASVHVRDMKSLPEAIRSEFINQQHWVISKSENKFSAIPIDQAHEQENKHVKGSGGVIGITQNPSALRRWLLSGPEISRLVNQFEHSYLESNEEEKQHPHHEQNLQNQKNFQVQVNKLSSVIQEMGNPFTDDFEELVNLDSRHCMDVSAVSSLRKLESIGKKQYKEFTKSVFEDRSKSIHDPIKRNSITIFEQKHRIIKHQVNKIKVLQNNVSLFGQLFIAMQSRDSDLDEFFSHEIQSYPPSLSNLGKLRLTSNKSDLLDCFEMKITADPPTVFDCKVMDGAVIVHSLPTTAVSTFNQYADQVFLPYIHAQLQTTSRIDIVWDDYRPESLKESTRQKRGPGIRRKVAGDTKIPAKWIDFLRDATNKAELFAFLTHKVEVFKWPIDKCVYVTSGNAVISIGGHSPMGNCDHEEADTRIVIHVTHSLQNGAKVVQVRTVDTDVIVIMTGIFYKLSSLYPSADIWIAFGMGKNFRFVHVNEICDCLGRRKSKALPFFHAFSGCDTTSAFFSKGKKSIWQAWQAHPDAIEAMEHLADHPFQKLDMDSDCFRILERLVVVMYDRTSHTGCINEARRLLFCQMNRSMEKLPPTKNCFLQHLRRVIYQASIWTQSMRAQLDLPSPQDFAWRKTHDSWEPVWMTVPEVSIACRELVKCSCKDACSVCKCAKANLECSPLCKCGCNRSN